MAVSAGFLEYALEQLGQVAPVTSRRMFGAVGIYSGGLFFALIDDDTLYFKVDDGNRADYVERGMEPFRPFGDRRPMQYYEVPTEVLEDAEELRGWVRDSLGAATRGRKRKGRKPGGPARRRT